MQSHIEKLAVGKITCSSWSWRFHSHVPLKQESTKKASNFTQMMACLEHCDCCGVKSSKKSKLRFFQCVRIVFSYPRFSLQWIRIENTCYKQYNKILDSPAIFEHIFFCKRLYDPENGAIKKVDNFPLVYLNLFINSTS